MDALLCFLSIRHAGGGFSNECRSGLKELEPEKRGIEMEANAISEPIDMLSQMDIILPTQYFGALGSVGLSSEQRLMLAVLVDAINVLRGWQRAGGGRKRRAFAEAAQWVNTTGTHYPFSFDSVCDALEIDSEVLRSRLRAVSMGLINTTRNPVGRLRLKELSRAHHMSANRLRRRGRTPALLAIS
jgi:hypothetical protein